MLLGCCCADAMVPCLHRKWVAAAVGPDYTPPEEEAEALEAALLEFREDPALEDLRQIVHEKNPRGKKKREKVREQRSGAVMPRCCCADDAAVLLRCI